MLAVSCYALVVNWISKNTDKQEVDSKLRVDGTDLLATLADLKARGIRVENMEMDGIAGWKLEVFNPARLAPIEQLKSEPGNPLR